MPVRPHKDDLLVEMDGRSAKTYGSQGQTRTAALSLKLAQRDIFFQETGECPVLLLDDVLSELDAPAAGLRPQPHPGGTDLHSPAVRRRSWRAWRGARPFHIHGGALV